MKVKGKQFFQNTLLIFIGIVISLIIIEFGLRMTIGRRPALLNIHKAPHPFLQHIHPPNLNARINFEEHPMGYFYLVTNNHGLREDSDSAYDRGTYDLRIIVLGDSQTDGTVFNNESYSNLVEGILKSKGKNADVLNAGVAGYSVYDELLWLNYIGRKYSFDLILVGIYVGNDLAELNNFDQVFVSSEGDVYIDSVLLKPKKITIAQNLKTEINDLMVWSLFHEFFTSNSPRNEDLPKLEAHRFCRGCYWQSLNQANLFDKEENHLVDCLYRFENSISEIAKVAKEMNSEVIFLIIPTKQQVEGIDSDSRYQQVIDILKLSPGMRDFDSIAHQKIIKILNQGGYNYIDLLPGLQISFQNDKQALYYFSDWHLNPYGHQQIANLVSEYLMSRDRNNLK